MVKANVDRILDILRVKKSVTAVELSRQLKLSKEDILKSAEYLEEDGVVKIENKFPNAYVTFLKEPASSASNEMPMPPPAPKAIRVEQPNFNALGTSNKFEEPAPKVMQPELNAQKPVLQEPKPILQQPNLNVQQQSNIAQDPNPNLRQPNLTAGKYQNTQQQDMNLMQPNNKMDQPKMQEMNFPDMNSQENPFTASEPSSTTFSQPPPIPKQTFLPNTDNPLEEKPQFDLIPPVPGNQEPSRFQRIEPNPPSFSSFEDTVPAPVAKVLVEEPKTMPVMQNVPSYVKSDTEKIDFMIDTVTKKIEEQDYTGMNGLYRQIYDLFKSSDSLSPNERYIIGDKINELFLRIKRAYIIENAI